MATFTNPVVPQLPPPPSNSSDPILSPATGVSVCLPKFKTAQDFLDLFDRLVPFEYIEPLKSPGPGYEILQMFAAVFERASLAVGRAECSFHALLAHGGNKSKGTVEFFRTSAANGSFTLLKDSVVRASKTNREYLLLADVVFGATDLKKVATIEARTADFQFDVKGITTDFAGALLEGEVDELIIPLMDPVFAEPTLLVRQATDIDNGQPATLDQIGADRSIDKSVGESDDAYRLRVRNSPETVSPDAILSQLTAYFRPSGVTFKLVEVFENSFQSCWNAPDTAILNQQIGDFDPNLFVYNDPRDIPGNRWLNAETTDGGFVVFVPSTTFADSGFADDAVGVPDNTGVPAYDVTLDTAGVYDGVDTEGATFFLGLINLLQKIKLAGVASIIELESQ